jgi:hypothetical protein
MPINLTGSFAISGSVDAQSFTQRGQPLTSNPFPFTGSAIISGSLNVIGSTSQNGVAIKTNPFPHTGSAAITGSLAVTGSVGFSVNLPLGTRAWSAGGALITARQSLAGAGTQNEGLAIGGCFSGAVCGCTEEYDGTSWTAGGALITARQLLAGAGTQNSGLAFGGRTVLTTPLSCTEEYDGTSWTAGGALIIARHSLAGAGTQNSGLAFGGASPAGVSCTEEYDGASWSVSGALITGRCQLAGAGTQNQALAFGGVPTVSCTEEYNGTSWSSGGALITARQSLAGAGTQNAGLAFGGFASPASVSCTEEYNGSSWSTGGALITARFCLAGEGEQNTALAFGGASPSGVSCTEEYTGAPVLTKTFDYSSTTGETTVSCLIETSAERYKSNIQPLGSQLSNIMQLQPVEFDWKTNKKHDMGFVADSVENIYPNLVSKNEYGEVEGMNYSKMVSVLVKTIQEQQTILKDLNLKFNNLSQ